MRWITRERPKIDRVACPWLVQRFIDPAAEFIFVPANQVLPEAQARAAAPYDIPGVELGRFGEQCSFDAFLAKYNLDDPALAKLAEIVRAADTGKPEISPQAHGLLAIPLGLSHNFSDDHEMLKHVLVMYGTLFSVVPKSANGNAQLAASRNRQ